MSQSGEGKIQTDIMSMLLKHPLVAWSYVTSCGTYKGLKGGYPIKIGIPGMPDIIGQLRNGRLFGIEVKQPGKNPTDIQQQFIDMINANGGLAGVATSIDDALSIID